MAFLSFNFGEERKVECLKKTKTLPVGREASVRRGSTKDYKRCSLKNFAKLTGNQIYQISFFDKVAGLLAATSSKKRLPYKYFYRTHPDDCFCRHQEFFKNRTKM